MIESFRHNSWATLRLLEFCRELDPALLETLTGTQVTIREELANLVGNEEALLAIIEGGGGGQHVPPPRTASLEDLLDRAEWLAERWERWLDRGEHPERLVEHEHDGEQRLVRVGPVLAQTIQQGNHPRGHVCQALGTADIQPPALDSPAYSAWVAEHEDHRAGLL